MSNSLPRGRHWAVILAAGNDGSQGTRPWFRFVERRPARFRTLRPTADCVARIVAPLRLVTVIDREHVGHFRETVGAGYPGTVFMQPTYRGTGIELLLALAHVLERDPQATVLVLPAGDFLLVQPSALRAAVHACLLAGQLGGRPVVLGQIPHGPDPDRIWIELGERCQIWGGSPGEQPFGLRSLEQSLDRMQAKALYLRGGLWCTSVLAASAQFLWELGRRCLPHTLPRFERFRAELSADGGSGGALERLFDSMLFADLRLDLLRHAGADVTVLPVNASPEAQGAVDSAH
ncbi:MAG TPA: hypothetical protein VJS92_14265 [Candidatus Polarisedimenticolaceae bacterium]|nr:hypothetical protein [Candidatus Polarisedimenticolaceae bacterium]